MKKLANNYSLIAQNVVSREIEALIIDGKLYSEEFSECVKSDIALIDLITMKFHSQLEFTSWLFEKEKLQYRYAELFATSVQKFKDKTYVREYELIYDKSEKRTPILTSLAQTRLKGEEISQNKELDKFLNKFLTKIHHDKCFDFFMTSAFSKVDKYVVDKIIIHEANNKTTNTDFSIKYELRDKFSNYLVIRGIVLMWNIYDNLIAEYEKEGKKTKQRKQDWIMERYIQCLNANNIRRQKYDEIITLSGKDYIYGQVTLTDYMKEITAKPEETKTVDPVGEMIREGDKLRNTPFDNVELQKIELAKGRDAVFNSLSDQILKTLSLEDRFRLGIFDYPDYKRAKYEESRANGRILH